MKKMLFGIFFFLIGSVKSQAPANQHYNFLNHLAAGHKNAEAIYLLNNDSENLGKDTISYLLGYNYHFLKKPDSAALYLAKVRPQSTFHTASRFVQSLNLLYANKKETYKVFSDVPEDTLKTYYQMYCMVKGANHLLARNYAAFDSVASFFKYDNYSYASEQQHLIDMRNNMQRSKKKSPALAGLLSAAVPGLGKIYAGRKGAGLSAFFMNAVLAGMAYENFYRSGYKSPQFIFFGSIFTFFYAGNIMGSVYSVKQQTRSVNGKLNNEIIATIHIPVNRLFLQ